MSRPLVFAAMATLIALGAQAQSKPSAAAQTLMKLEKDWSDADVKKDVAALDRILAEDWTGIDFQGTVMNKAAVLKEVAMNSDVTATESTVLGEMKIRVYGNTAIVSGTEVEKSQYRGEDSSGKYIWTDVFVQRNGRWQAVSSQSTKLVIPKGDTSLARLQPIPVHKP
jgi:ketosteroid isomerase-like protein